MFNIFTAIKRWFVGLDKNDDGVVNTADAAAVIKNVADVNNDGVVDKADAKAVVAKIKQKIKMTRSQLNAISKQAIQTHGKNIGVELDRDKMTKKQMIEAILKHKI